MLLICRGMRELNFSDLAAVYDEGIHRRAHRNYRDKRVGLWEETQNFLWYLESDFFRTPGAVYMIWQEAGIYRSALRLRPYRDGLLLDGLETAPPDRRRGYAGKLVHAALDRAGNMPVYSHVDKRNTASLTLHEACGFRVIADHAELLDGTVTHACVTMMHRR